MKIYNITRGQLITIWIFGLIATLVSLFELDSYDPSGWATIFLILIPCVLVFYTVGWRSYKKQSPSNRVNQKDLSNCTDCGSKISSESKYCQSCGKNLYV